MKLTVNVARNTCFELIVKLCNLDINYSLDNAYDEQAKRCEINISKKRFLFVNFLL